MRNKKTTKKARKDQDNDGMTNKGLTDDDREDRK